MVHQGTHLSSSPKLVLFANTDWYLWNFRRTLALAARHSGCDMLLLSPPGEYGERFAGIGLRWIPLAMKRGGLNPFREFLVLWRLFRLFRRERPALVHAFALKCVVYAGIAAQMARVPAQISAVTGMGPVFAERSLKARILRKILKVLLRVSLLGKRTLVILQNSDDMTLFNHATLIDSSRLRLIRSSGVDTTRFVARPEQGVTVAEMLCVVLPGRIVRHKGIPEYVEASRLLRESGQRLRLLLAGAVDPDAFDSIPLESVRAWEEEGLLEWVGHVDDMAALYASADIVVLPSYVEGLPRSLIEAAACALPIVTTDVPGCREVVTDGVDGLLVPPHDAKALARAIARLADSRELRTRLGHAARHKALAEFDERAVIKKTLDVYRELGIPLRMSPAA